MATIIVNCAACGRDTPVSEKSMRKNPSQPRYCGRCVGHSSHISDQRGRRVMRLSPATNEDQYDEESLP